MSSTRPAADDHVTLGDLLRKERAEPRRSAVHRVAAQPLTVTQKIEAIRSIDERGDAVGVLQVVRAASAQAARNYAGRISLTIKKEIPVRSYFRFLFTDFFRVRKFGRRSYVLDARILPPGMRVSPGLIDFLSTEIHDAGRELAVCLIPAVTQGWLYLTPKNYNLLVILKRLADRVQVFDFTRLNIRSPKTIDRLRRIESLFLMLHYDPQTMRVIFDALRGYFEKQHVPEKECTRTFSLVLRLLAEDCTVPSLYNCLLGLNMYKLRRSLGLRALMREGLGEMVDVSRFDFDPSVRARVGSRIDDTLESVKMLHDRLSDARRTSSYIAVDAGGRPDMGALRDLYERVPGRGSFSFTGDQDNLVLFLSRVLQSFHKAFSPLLNGQCLLEQQGRVTIFSPHFFALDFVKLGTLAERLEQRAFRYSRFPLTRYLKIKGGRLQAIGQEMEVSQLIGQGTACLADLGKAIMKVLSLRAPAHEPVHSRGTLEPVILHGKSFSLPFEDCRIKAGS
ncbi:MAG: hypothetical protein ABSG21_15745, partial [Spirochaetia bacterium]